MPVLSCGKSVQTDHQRRQSVPHEVGATVNAAVGGRRVSVLAVSAAVGLAVGATVGAAVRAAVGPNQAAEQSAEKPATDR